MPYKPKAVAKALQKLGFNVARQKGSHLHLKNDAGKLVTIPMHNQDLKLGTLRAILRQADVTLEALEKHL